MNYLVWMNNPVFSHSFIAREKIVSILQPILTGRKKVGKWGFQEIKVY